MKNILCLMILIFLGGCMLPTSVMEVETDISPASTQEIEAKVRTSTPSPEITTPSPSARPTKTATAASSPTATLISTPSIEDIEFAESLQVTYTAIAVDMEERIDAFNAGIRECEVTPRDEGWRDFRVEEIGLSMKVPAEWFDYEYRTDSPGNLPYGSAYGWVGSSSPLTVENVNLAIWKLPEIKLLDFIKDLRYWAADKEGYYAMLFSPLPNINSLVNGQPASITYVPNHASGDNSVSQSAFVAVTKIGDYIILLSFTPRPAYDATETFTTLLSSMTIDGVEGGKTEINKVIRCQLVVTTCMSQCWFSFPEMMDESVIRP